MSFKCIKFGVFASMLAFTFGASAQQQQINVICSVQQEWCQMISTVYQKTRGVRINMQTKGSGEALAQITAERQNPRVDVWFGGTGDPHLQAAELDLTEAYTSPKMLDELRLWAISQHQLSGGKTVGIYMGPLGFGFNTETLAKKKIPEPTCWSDLVKPIYKGEIQMANPASSGTAYVAIASLVQVMGEEKAFDYLKQLHRNISAYPRSGVGPIKAVARGEASVSVSFVHDAPGEALQGFPVKANTPCEGTGFEIGSMSIIKGAKNMDEAKKFYDWALSPAVQEMGAAAKQFQLPSNKNAKVHPLVPPVNRIKLIAYDFKKYGSSAERKRLIDRWEKEVNSMPR